MAHFRGEVDLPNGIILCLIPNGCGHDVVVFLLEPRKPRCRQRSLQALARKLSEFCEKVRMSLTDLDQLSVHGELV